MPSLTMPLARAVVLGLAIAALLAVLAPAPGIAQVDPAGCTDEVAFDPAIPTYQDVVGRPLRQIRAPRLTKHLDTQDSIQLRLAEEATVD